MTNCSLKNLNKTRPGRCLVGLRRFQTLSADRRASRSCKKIQKPAICHTHGGGQTGSETGVYVYKVNIKTPTGYELRAGDIAIVN